MVQRLIEYQLAKNLTLLVPAIAATSAHPATVTATFAVSAVVEERCTVAASRLPHGAIAGTVTAPGNLIAVACDLGTPYRVVFTEGQAIEADNPAATLTGQDAAPASTSNRATNSSIPARLSAPDRTEIIATIIY